jgi:hypothetical protein
MPSFCASEKSCFGSAVERAAGEHAHHQRRERRQGVELRVELRDRELDLRERLPRQRERSRHPQPVARARRHDRLEKRADLELTK